MKTNVLVIGMEEEDVFIPGRLAIRLKDYIGVKGIKPGEKIVPNGLLLDREFSL